MDVASPGPRMTSYLRNIGRKLALLTHFILFKVSKCKLHNLCRTYFRSVSLMFLIFIECKTFVLFFLNSKLCVFSNFGSQSWVKKLRHLSTRNGLSHLSNYKCVTFYKAHRPIDKVEFWRRDPMTPCCGSFTEINCGMNDYRVSFNLRRKTSFVVNDRLSCLPKTNQT